MIWLLDFFDGIGRFLAGLLAAFVPLVYCLGAAFVTDRAIAMRRAAGKTLAGKYQALIFIITVSILFLILQPIRGALERASCGGSSDFKACNGDDSGDGVYDRP